MSNNQYNIQLNKLCLVLDLGELIKEPLPISGGHLHKMYSIQTTKGKYAVKAINPNIIIRPAAKKNYIDSENIAQIASRNIPAVCAKRFKGQALLVIDNQYYLIFDWLDGKTLKGNDITVTHCNQIGKTLAKIHSIDYSVLDLQPDEYDFPLIDWNFYLNKGREVNAIWSDLLSEHINEIIVANQKAYTAFELLSSDLIISHGDLDPKNVMWNTDMPYVIDWESANFVNPIFDLLNTALYWSTEDTGIINEDKLKGFISNYHKIIPVKVTDWTPIINASCPLITWLEYSLKRSLKIECADEKEQQLGTEQAIYSINTIINYPNKMLNVINILHQL